MNEIKKIDPILADLIELEKKRQQDGLEMIPSENFTSLAVMEAMGSILTNKYSEGYPHNRYYGGCEFVDQIEELALKRAKKLFGTTHANVQPYSGSPANLAVYFALCEPNDTIMGMSLFYGGHMTHGLSVNFSGTYYNSIQYTSDKNGFLDYNQMADLAQKHKPKLIVVGATAYPRIFDWNKLREIANISNSFMLADISHISGLIIAGEHPSPVNIADVITTTTHKTLRGPRGAIILCNGNESTPLKKVPKTKENIPTLIDRAIIPGLQGGPHNHQTAGIAVALLEASKSEFIEYGKQIVKNAKALAKRLLEHNFNLITGGTDNHLMVIDLTNKNITGKQAEKLLDKAGITCNKNTIPFEPRSPFDPSGIRLGTPALTTRNMKEPQMEIIADFINRVIQNQNNQTEIIKVRQEVLELCSKFPLY